MTKTVQQQVDELRGLIERATAGPWHAASQRLEGADTEVVGDSNNSIWSGTEHRPYPVATFAKVRGADGGPWVPMCHIEPGDAALIVAAVNALPTILNELDIRLARIGELEAALLPFARIAQMTLSSKDGASVGVNVNLCRRAAELLTPKAPEVSNG